MRNGGTCWAMFQGPSVLVFLMLAKMKKAGRLP